MECRIGGRKVTQAANEARNIEHEIDIRDRTWSIDMTNLGAEYVVSVAKWANMSDINGTRTAEN